MIHVGHDQLETVLVRRAEEQIEQGDRVGAARDRHQSAALRQREGREMRAELGEEIHRPES